MYPIDWEKTFTNIFAGLNALGSIATVGAFIYLFRKDKDKQAQIDKLTSIAAELTKMKEIDNEKLNLSVKPEIRIDKTHYNGTDQELDIDIENIGERAILIKFELISEDVILHNEHLPHVMQKGSTRKIFARASGVKHIKDSEYIIKLHYKDKIDNLYISEIKGVGSRARINLGQIQFSK